MASFFKTIFRGAMWVLSIGTYKMDKGIKAAQTSSPDAIRATYNQAKDDKIERFNNIKTAVGRIQMEQSQLELKLKELSDEEAELGEAIEGLIQEIEEDPENAELLEDFNRLDARQTAIDSEQESLASNIEALNADKEEYVAVMRDLSEEIRGLEQEAESTVAQMEIVRLRKDVEAERSGLMQSDDMSAVSAVRQKLAQEKAELSVAKEVSGTNMDNRMKRYKNRVKGSASNDKLQKILAERAAANKAKKAGSTVPVEEISETERKV